MVNLDEVIDVLETVVRILKLPGTDVAWSRYQSGDEAVADVNHHIGRLRGGDPSHIVDLTLLFAPTGSLQEISISSGWGDAFLDLAARFDRAIEAVGHVGSTPV